MIGLLATFIAGLSFLVGCIIAIFIKRKDKIISFSISMSFAALIIIILFEMLPESIEKIENNTLILIISGIFIGLAILMLLDSFIPHHGEHENESENLVHIGTVTAISLIIHGLIEGAFIYGYAMVNARMGIIYGLVAALYHIPLGINIALCLKDKPKKMWMYMIFLTIAPLMGGLIIHSFDSLLTDSFLGFMLAITMGMVIYIIFGELLIKMKKNFNKYAIFGIITGIILVLLGKVV